MADAEIIDAVFDAGGDMLPVDYPFALWQALLHHVPELEAAALAGVLPLRTAESEAGRLLPKRAKLVLRLPQALAPQAEALSGRQLDIGGHVLRLGALRLREIQPYPTLHAHLVVGGEDEVEFMREVEAQLAELGVAGKLICGMRTSMAGPEQVLHGYSLVVHDLKPEASLRLQYSGLGAGRHFGCGIFVPYKAITGLE